MASRPKISSSQNSLRSRKKIYLSHNFHSLHRVSPRKDLQGSALTQKIWRSLWPSVPDKSKNSLIKRGFARVIAERATGMVLVNEARAGLEE